MSRDRHDYEIRLNIVQKLFSLKLTYGVACPQTCQGRGEAPAPPVSDGDGAAAGADGSRFIMCRLCHLCFPSGDLLRAHSCQYADQGGVIQVRHRADRLVICL